MSMNNYLFPFQYLSFSYVAPSCQVEVAFPLHLLNFCDPGDNIFGSTANDAAESLLQAFAPVMRLGIPWAAVLGNHDQESTMTREELMSFISLMDFSLSQTFPSVEDNSHLNKQDPVPNIDGFGNYNLRVWGAPGSNFANSTVLNFYFLDSGDRAIVNGVKTYDWIKESQLSWLRNVSQEVQVKLLLILNFNHSELHSWIIAYMYDLVR